MYKVDIAEPPELVKQLYRMKNYKTHLISIKLKTGKWMDLYVSDCVKVNNEWIELKTTEDITLLENALKVEYELSKV